MLCLTLFALFPSPHATVIRYLWSHKTSHLQSLCSSPGHLQACASVLACSRFFQSAHGWSWRHQWLSPGHSPPAPPWPDRKRSTVSTQYTRLKEFFLVWLRFPSWARKDNCLELQRLSLGEKCTLVYLCHVFHLTQTQRLLSWDGRNSLSVIYTWEIRIINDVFLSWHGRAVSGGCG